VNEQCLSASVQVSNTGPATINDAGNFNINVDRSNYAFVIWHLSTGHLRFEAVLNDKNH